MTDFHRPLPSDEDVMKVLAGSRVDPDPRAAPLVTLILSIGLRPNQARRLCWSEVRPGDSRITIRGTRSSPPVDHPVTPWLVQQLLAISVRRNDMPVFAMPSVDSLSINQILNRVLERAGLGHLSWQALTAWSARQSPARRASIANV